MNDHRLSKILRNFDRLPSMPGIAIKLIEAIQKPDPDLREVARLISSDAALSAKTLKIVNSSFYSFVNKVTTIDQAIRMLGLNTVKNLSLSLILKTQFLKDGNKDLKLVDFWKDSLIGAVAAKLIAAQAKIRNAEDAFFLGLLSNIGSLTLAYLLPDQYALVQSEIRANRLSPQDAENQVFGFNHTDVGALLTRSWGLPETFHLPIQHHHRLENLPQTYCGHIRMRTIILHLASLFIELVNSPTMAATLGRIAHVINSYGLQDSLDAGQIGKELIKQTREICPIFDIQFKEENELESLLEKARQEVLNISVDLVGELIRKNSELELLRLQANQDAMTTLFNYKAFCDALHQEMSKALRYHHVFSLVLADIDFFKSVNDNFGHLAGDQALKAVSQNLRSQLRENDFVARYGGEEFAIILPETSLDNALIVVERLRQKIRTLDIVYNSQSIRITMSFGVTAFRRVPPMSFNDLLKSADDALYAAKKQGRDRCCAAA